MPDVGEFRTYETTGAASYIPREKGVCCYLVQKDFHDRKRSGNLSVADNRSNLISSSLIENAVELIGQMSRH
jgi:hypothetical protein